MIKVLIAGLFLVGSLTVQSANAADKVVVIPLNSSAAPSSSTDGQMLYNDNGVTAGSNVFYNKANGAVGMNVPNPGWAKLYVTNEVWGGLWGHSDDNLGAIGSSDTAYGVYGISGSNSGVFGTSTSSSGVRGQSTDDYGVYAYSTNYRGLYAGTGNPAWYSAIFDGGAGIRVNGNSYFDGNTVATGTKSFVEPHPTDPGKSIYYVSLEGPEAGTYIRGTSQLENGQATVELPEHFDMVTSAQGGLTAQLTPRGDCNGLYIKKLTTTSIEVAELGGGNHNVSFDYLIQGVRTGYEDFEVIRDSQENMIENASESSMIDAPDIDNKKAIEAILIENSNGKRP